MTASATTARESQVQSAAKIQDNITQSLNLKFTDIPASYTLREERINALTHAIGIPIALVLTTVLTFKARGFTQIFSALAFGIGMLCVFTASTCYHAARSQQRKHRLRILDHASIYMMIAGLYTPYMLVGIPERGGIPTTIVVWSVAFIGVFLELTWVGRPKWLIGGLYVLLGWGLMLQGPAIYNAIGATGFWLLIAGGTFCSLGVIFYLQKSKEFMHAIFHSFVLISMFPTWLSIYFYVMR